jgi:hypothetical protein
MHIRLRNIEWSGNYVWWIGVNIKKWSQSTLLLGRYVEQRQRPESDELFSGPELEPDTVWIRNRSATPYRVMKNCPSQRGNKKFRDLFTSSKYNYTYSWDAAWLEEMISVRESLVGKFHVRAPFKNPVVVGSALITLIFYTEHWGYGLDFKACGQGRYHGFPTRVPQRPRFPQNIEGSSAKNREPINKDYEIWRKFSNVPRNTAGIFIRQMAILQ